MLDCFGGGGLRWGRRLIDIDCCCEIGARQINAAKRVADGDGAKRRADGIRPGADKDNLATAIFIDDPGDLCASDAEACRGKLDLHCLRAGFGELSRDKPEGTLGDLRCHGTGLCCRVIDKFVHRQFGAASQREDRLVKKHDLHSAVGCDLDLVTEKNACAGEQRSDITATFNCRHADHLAAERRCHPNEFGGYGAT